MTVQRRRNNPFRGAVLVPAMRVPLLVLLLATPALLGCLGDEPGQDTPDTPTPDLPGDRVMRYDGTGSLLPLPDGPLGETSYHLTGHAGAEPNLGITASGAILATAFDEVIRSTDGGATWEQVWVLGLEGAGAPVDPIRNFDPMLWVDTDTDRIFNVPMNVILGCAQIVWSDDDGSSWTEGPEACGPVPPFDHQKFATGPPSAQAPPMAGMVYPNVAILCYGQLASNVCMMSYDGGLTWPVSQPVWNLAASDGSSCASQNGHPAFSEDGVIVVPKAWGCDGLYVVVSEDSGQTWTLKPGPKVGGDTVDPDVTFTPDGTLYALWQGDDHLSYLARSSDNGDSWDGPWVVSPPGVGSSVFAAISSGTDGRVAMSFVGTRDTTKYPNEAPDEARWHLYIVTSDDAHTELPTFTSHQVTPDEDPVQVGCVWIGGGGNPCRNLLEFIDSAVHPDTGDVHIIYTEGCTDGCAGKEDATGDDSRDRQVALARLDGWSLGG